MDTAKFEKFDNQSFHRFSNPSIIEKDLQTLYGIISGIKSDALINDVELKEVRAWVNAHKQYEDKQPYKEVIGLIRAAFDDNILTHDEAENIQWFCSQYTHKSRYFDLVTSGIQRLIGIIKGISIDNEINQIEIAYLDKWLEENDYLKNTWPYDELYNLITNIIRDQIITKEEHEELLTFCKAISGNNNYDSNSEIVAILKTGFCQIDPNITIQENTFCITGVSKKYRRKHIAEKIEMFGGYVVDNVNSKLNYLVVCDGKNSCWAFTCYGRKIEEAIKHRKDGAKLVIVHEYDLFDRLEDYK